VKLDFSGLKILVIGDPMHDTYHFGHVDRVSPEAPVPVFIEDEVETRAGGAANVFCQLEEFECNVREAWSSHKDWTEKHRYMVGNHQLFRHDIDRCVPNGLPVLEGFDAIVISDYAKGGVTPELCSQAIRSGIKVFVDPKGADWEKYRGAFAICPNEKEYKAKYRTSVDESHIFLKRGPAGIDLIEAYTSTRKNFSARARHVYDVTGAGDTVVATVAACLAGGGSLSQAAELANIAAGIVVGEVGTTVCALDSLMAALTSSTKDTNIFSPSVGTTANTSSLQLTPTDTVSGLKEWNAHTTLSLHELPTSGPWPRRSSLSKDGRKL
jgi:D-beta-D-heptose 7-phosphate kinase/D-beta-D-heptose 1-phosphate adenosyltransferase